MKTSFKTPDQYAEAILHIADMQEPENETAAALYEGNERKQRIYQ